MAAGLRGAAEGAAEGSLGSRISRLLTRAGCEVVVPRNLGCCGALTHHMGKEGAAISQARAAIAAFLAADAEAPAADEKA